MKRKLCILMLFFATLTAWADSPLTSTNFWRIYNTTCDKTTYPLYIVYDNEGWSPRVMDLLCSTELSVEQRLCLVNYIGWVFEGQNHFSDLLNHYTEKNNYKGNKGAALKDMKGDMLTVFAYVKAMDNYFEVDDAKYLSSEAVKRSPKSRAAAMIDALIGAQIAMDSDWAEVYNLCHKVEENTKLNNDFCDAAIVAIMEYIDLYK